MKGNLKKRMMAIVIAMLMAITIGATASAASNYDAVTGTANAVTFKKYLVIPKDANVPNMTFNFVIEAGTPVAGDSSNLPIYAGVGTPVIAANQAAFTSSDTTTDGTATDGITNDATKKYAEKDVVIDFSSISFTEPGVYRYIISESTPPAGSSIIGNSKRTLDVNVVDEDGALSIKTYVMYYGEVSTSQNKTTVKETSDNKNANAEGIAVGDKCDNFINKYPSQNLYIGKKVAGNQGSKDKYFRITVNLSGAGDSTIIDVNGNYTTTPISSSINSATIILDEDLDGESTYTNKTQIVTSSLGTTEVHFYLQGDQYINLMGIPEGATYTITEYDYSSDGYVKTETSATDTFTIGSGDSAKTFKDSTTGTIGTEDIYTGFINTKSGVIPTGVLLSATGLIVVGIIVVIGIVFFGIRSKKRYEEE